MKKILSLLLVLSAFSLISAQRYLPQTRFLQAEETDTSEGVAPAPSPDESGDGAAGGEQSGDEGSDESTDESGDTEDETPPPDEGDTYDGGDEYIEGDTTISGLGSNINLPGDQFIKLSLGVTFPLNFPNFPALFKKPQLYIGGLGWIGYNYFLTEYLAIGFDVGFGFNVSIGSKVFNYVPFMFAATYQPVIWRLEFPLTLEVGFAWHSHSGQNYFPALALKAEAGVMFRLTEGWSVGLDFLYYVSPEFKWGKSDGITKWGQFLDVAAMARYHF